MTTAQISCFTNSYGRFGGAAALEHLPEVGIEWLELPIRTAGAPPFFGDEPLITSAASTAEVARLEQRIAGRGLRLSSCNVTSGNPLDPAVLKITLRKLELAADFGVSLVVGGAGEAATPDEEQTLLRHLRDIGNQAAKLNLIYCFETHPGLCVSPQSMLNVMIALDHPRLRLNYDTGNVLYYNKNLDWAAGLRLVRDYVYHVHLKDTNGYYNEWHFPALGAGGAIDFALVKQLLDEVGFAGPYSLEIEGIQGEPEQSLADYQHRIAASVAHLQRSGFGGQVSGEKKSQ